jgi:hypothetical protein
LLQAPARPMTTVFGFTILSHEADISYMVSLCPPVGIPCGSNYSTSQVNTSELQYLAHIYLFWGRYHQYPLAVSKYWLPGDEGVPPTTIRLSFNFYKK